MTRQAELVETCPDCGAPATGNPQIPFVHRDGCETAIARERARALRDLSSASAERDELEGKLDRARELVNVRIREAAEFKAPKTRIAAAANLDRKRVYAILNAPENAQRKDPK